MVNLEEKIDRKCGFCRGDLYVLASYKYPPKGETNFNLEPYWRRLLKCKQCGHSVNQHRFEFDTDFYSNLYSASTYKGQLRSRFQKIMSFAPYLNNHYPISAFYAEFLEKMEKF